VTVKVGGLEFFKISLFPKFGIGQHNSIDVLTVWKADADDGYHLFIFYFNFCRFRGLAYKTSDRLLAVFLCNICCFVKVKT